MCASERAAGVDDRERKGKRTRFELAFVGKRLL